jgi:hypothetical protein
VAGKPLNILLTVTHFIIPFGARKLFVVKSADFIKRKYPENCMT